ncbi:hypothetical protein FOZ62_016038, partial [Perkinsus olseni]
MAHHYCSFPTALPVTSGSLLASRLASFVLLHRNWGVSRAFKDFDVETLVRQASEATSIDQLVDAVVEGDFDVVRSRRKIESVYRNAEAARTVQG